MNSRAFTISLCLLVLGFLAGSLWLAHRLGELTQNKPEQQAQQPPPRKPLPTHSSSSKSTLRESSTRALAEHVQPVERLITFEDEESYRNALASIADQDVLLLGKLDNLRTLRLWANSERKLDELFGDQQMSQNFLVLPPLPIEPGKIQAGAVGFGGSSLSWLGVDRDNSNWGKGVTVAVIDTGISEHSALGNFQQINLESVTDITKLNGHGTAVASIIAGQHPVTPGVAPAADLLSIRVADGNGESTSFSLAEGIVAAVDAGADILNISMGSYGDSVVVRNAVDYAQQAGVVIVASSGNEGLGQSAYPAAYDGVISVGAIDARGEHLDFSNSSSNLTTSAPGLEVNAAYPGDNVIAATGTSFSAPFVAGTIAAVMSEYPNLTAQQAADLVIAHGNENGAPGADPFYGESQLDIGRVFQHDTAGIFDAAIASNFYQPASESNLSNQLLVTVENRGTETLINLPVKVHNGNSETLLNITTLPAGKTHTFYLPINLTNLAGGETLNITSTLSPPQSDIKPSNNTRSSQLQNNHAEE